MTRNPTVIIEPAPRRAGLRRRALCTVLATLLLACQSSGFEPAAIAAEDICAFCKMSISEKRYAAEFIDREQEARKFDDISCMVKYVTARGNKDAIAAYYFVDYDARGWVKTQDARFVRSREIRTPMNGGIIAFADESRAREAANKYQGELISFDQVWGSDSAPE